jgi:hypothetical protein
MANTEKVIRKGKDFYEKKTGKWIGQIDGDRSFGYFFEYSNNKTYGFVRFNKPKIDPIKGHPIFSMGVWSYFMDAVNATREMLNSGMYEYD